MNKLVLINRKSQAAMEFLMTYGWAILVVLVAISALAYFGVLSPDKFLPSDCKVSAGIACVDKKVSDTGITVTLQNGMGIDMSNLVVTAEGCGQSSALAALNSGDKRNISIACTLGGSKYNGDLSVAYTNSDTGLTHNVTGKLVDRIE